MPRRAERPGRAKLHGPATVGDILRLMPRAATAGLVVIGDEILSGKITDANTPFLIGELRALGVSLREIAVVSDAVASIAAAVRRLAGSCDHVFTSGGVGPTHDDVTMAGVAAAFDTEVVRHPELDGLIRSYYAAQGTPVLERNLRMADVPAGATLIASDQLRWPVLAMRNVYILPGIPEIFRRKFLAIRERFRDAPFHLRQIFVRPEEGAIAQHLDTVAAAFPAVALGSYPLMAAAEDGHRVRLTLEGKDADLVERAAEQLAHLLGAADIVRQA